MKRVKLILLTGLAATTLAACGGHAHYVRSGPYPPPPPAAYRVPPPPGPGFVWIASYRDWRGSRYVLVPGRWVRPPRRNAVWVPGHWKRRGGHRVWISAHWR